MVNSALIDVVFFIQSFSLTSPKKRLIAFPRSVALRKYGERIVQSSVSFDVVFDPKNIIFFCKLGAGFRLSKKQFFSVKKYQLEIFFDYDIS